MCCVYWQLSSFALDLLFVLLVCAACYVHFPTPWRIVSKPQSKSAAPSLNLGHREVIDENSQLLALASSIDFLDILAMFSNHNVCKIIIFTIPQSSPSIGGINHSQMGSLWHCFNHIRGLCHDFLSTWWSQCRLQFWRVDTHGESRCCEAREATLPDRGRRYAQCVWRCCPSKISSHASSRSKWYINTYIHALNQITLHDVTLPYLPLPCIALRYIALHFTTYIYIYIHTYIYTMYGDLHGYPAQIVSKTK